MVPRNTTLLLLLLLMYDSYSRASPAAAAAAVGHTRTGSASLYARLVGLTLEPFAHALDFVVCFLVPNSKLGTI